MQTPQVTVEIPQTPPPPLKQGILKITVGKETELSLDQETKPLSLVSPYDPILREKLEPYRFAGANVLEIEEILRQMIAVLIDHKAYGISANQVGLRHRVCVVGGADGMGYEAMFNPRIIENGKDEETEEEGCLSFPFLYLKVKRYTWVRVAWENQGGVACEHMFTGLTSRIIQHEIDHLDGITITQKVSPFELRRGKERAMKLAKRYKRHVKNAQGVPEAD
jgi:peptide deformylase